MSDELERKIEDAGRAVKQAQERLSEAKDALLALQQEKVKREHGVEAGCVVRYTAGRHEGAEYLVTLVDPRSYGSVLHGRKRRKDGEFGSRSQRIYGDWELVTPASVPQQ